MSHYENAQSNLVRALELGTSGKGDPAVVQTIIGYSIAEALLALVDVIEVKN